ncbi:MAG: glycosyltransferase [Pseudodesulfovibrio sp.]
MRIFFLSRSLERGGAERQLVATANGLARRGHDVRIGLFYSGGSLERDVDGPQLVQLGKRGRWDVLRFCSTLVREVRTFAPDAMYSFMGTANVLAAVLKLLWRGARVVWAVRSSDVDYSGLGWVAALNGRAEARLARFADLIIANSGAGKAHAVASGMPASRFLVIPNGIDTDRFAPDRESGTALRREWLPSGCDVLVGLAARLDPMKDHATFLRAARLASDRDPGLGFVCVGGGEGAYANEIRALAAELDLAFRLTWAGELDYMEPVYNALDICCLSSITEGFPNVVGEAMSCGVPCVVTDAGDAAAIVGEAGIVVPRRDPARLAEGLLRMAALVRGGQASDTRTRIVQSYSLEQMVVRTENALKEGSACERV